MPNDSDSLSAAELRDLQCIAGMIIPASTEFGVPGADDPIIFADIVKSLGRDRRDVQAAIASLCALAGGPFVGQDASRRYAAAKSFRSRGGPAVAALSRAILQCYYRDDRVVLSLGLEARPPFPRGHTLEQGDWSLLDPVRARPKLWRDAP
jgi:hypothetical protein